MQEKEFIEKAKAGDYVGFNYLLKNYWNYLNVYLTKQYNDPYLSEEICIQTFARAFDKIHAFKPQYEFKTWLVQIAKNLAIDEYRKKKLTTEPIFENTKRQIPDSVPSIEDEMIKTQDEDDLALELKKLPLHYQEIIEMRYFKEMSFKAISKELNIPVNNLKVRSLRAKKMLHQQLIHKT